MQINFDIFTTERKKYTETHKGKERKKHETGLKLRFNSLSCIYPV